MNGLLQEQERTTGWAKGKPIEDSERETRNAKRNIALSTTPIKSSQANYIYEKHLICWYIFLGHITGLTAPYFRCLCVCVCWSFRFQCISLQTHSTHWLHKTNVEILQMCCVVFTSQNLCFACTLQALIGVNHIFFLLRLLLNARVFGALARTDL